MKTPTDVKFIIKNYKLTITTDGIDIISQKMIPFIFPYRNFFLIFFAKLMNFTKLK
jgi:hypothetical protein